MARLPWFPFYPADWFRDTKCLSFAAKGAWADLLGILWDSKTRGTKTFDLDTWAAELGKPRREVEAVFTELKKRQIAEFVTDGNGAVTVSSRRQVREEKARENNRVRVSRFRGNAPVMDVKRKCTPSISESESESEGRRQKKSKSVTHAMPEGWSLSDTMKEYGSKQGMTPLTLQHEFEHCKAHHEKTGSRFTEKGWASSVWTTWVLKWIKFGSVQVVAPSVFMQPKCAFHTPCESRAVPNSKYCQEHREFYQRQQERLKPESGSPLVQDVQEDVTKLVGSLVSGTSMLVN